MSTDMVGLEHWSLARPELFLAVATALALSQSAALAKSSKGHTTKTSTKNHHKKHMHKS